MTKRLGKTEAALLLRLLHSQHDRIAIEWGSRLTQHWGGQDRNAAGNLLKRKLVLITSDGEHRDHNRGICTFSYCWTITLAPGVTHEAVLALLAEVR